MKSGFRRTEVGVIPEQWDAPNLGDILTSLQLGGNYKNSKRETSWPLIKMGNLGRGSISLNKLEYVDSDQAPACRDRLEKNDLLFNTRNTLDLVGKVAIWRGELSEAYFNSNIARMKFKADRVSSNGFMNYIMNTPCTLQNLRSIATGTTSVAAIYSRDLVQVKVLLPPPPEQEAIAEALGDADALIESLERLIAKKRDLKQGAMQELLTARRRLPGFTGKWKQLEFGSVATIRNDKTFASSMPAETPCVELESIGLGTGRLLSMLQASGSSSKYRFMKGDVLFGRLRAYLKKYWYATFAGVCSTEIWPLIPRSERLRSEYLHLIVQTSGFADAAGVSYGTHMPRSDWSILRKYGIQLPQVDEQSAIAAVLSDMDAEIAALEEKLGKARAIKQGMMQELLTGRIRLV